MVVLRSGYLIKQPIHGHFLSRPRKRYFVLTDDHLEWFQDEQARVPKDHDANKMQPLIKTELNTTDFFMFGLAPLGLLLFYGDVSSASAP